MFASPHLTLEVLAVSIVSYCLSLVPSRAASHSRERCKTLSKYVRGAEHSCPDVCTGGASRASCKATTQQEHIVTDVHGISKPAAPVPESPFTPNFTFSSQQAAAMPTTASSETAAEPAPGSTGIIGALIIDTKEPVVAASSEMQGAAATGTLATPAGKRAKPADFSVRRRPRKSAAPRSSMPCAVHEMPPRASPWMQRAGTANRRHSQPVVHRKWPTEKCCKELENVDPQTRAAVQPKAHSHRAAGQEVGGAARSTEPINAAAMTLQICGHKRTRPALAEIKNGITATVAAAALGEAIMTAAGITCEEEGPPAKRHGDAAAATQAQALPKEAGGSAERQSPAGLAAPAGELGAQQAVEMEMDGVPTEEAKLPAPARSSRPRGRPAKLGRRPGKAEKSAAAKDGAPSSDVEAHDGTVMAAPGKAVSPRGLRRVTRSTNGSISLENCPPSAPTAKMPQAPLPQKSSSGKPAYCAAICVGVSPDDQGTGLRLRFADLGTTCLEGIV